MRALVLALLLATTAHAQAPAESACHLPYTQIVIVGDSLSACSYDPGVRRDFCWPDYLRMWSGCHVTNLAVGAGAANFWEWADPISNSSCSPLFAGDCLGIIWLGDIGEYLIFLAGGSDPLTFQTDVQHQIDRMFAIGAARVKLIKPSTTSSLDVYPRSFLYREFLAIKLQELCDADSRVDCIDLRYKCENAGMYPPAGIHPTGSGQICFFAEIVPKLFQ